MEGKSEIRVFWKKRGATMGQALEHFRRQNPHLHNCSVTYAGRLDPMAEGVVLFLVGDMRFKKNEFLLLPKTYVFECLWGISTDTFDILGKIVSFSGIEPDSNSLKICSEEISQRQEQEYPPYSSRPVQGKPLFWWAREGKIKDIVIPKRSIKIFSLRILGSRRVSSSELRRKIERSLEDISGDFRQKEILALWRQVLEEEKTFLITTMSAKVSTGTYIRGLVETMGHCLGIGGVALSITRTSLGGYSQSGETEKEG